jgi:hypothetical protein
MGETFSVVIPWIAPKSVGGGPILNSLCISAPGHLHQCKGSVAVLMHRHASTCVYASIRNFRSGWSYTTIVNSEQLVWYLFVVH